ncbi:non-heme iron oxygenase ferredoxin subunit [Novosphingobium profundi]|uniref:anthranilate 1,2-dioxygenase ferredoxin subunit AndAb n=1 Tax=Novosphingobium profundi TaxID=1774954 RepID=UPI001BD91495|nr:anthranilate 1,2-dioxygenase ferredoxin subunit AndAb [Novosphingobium profundi]MBT0667424.1 non-heme iron oxygenase ferredoxin subunit [Novosphingobium profundi]
MTMWYAVAHESEIEDDTPFATEAKGTPLALFRIGGAIYALYDLCSHGAARLSDGFVEDGCVECPLHQGLIAIATGEPRSAPITEPVTAYPVRIVDGQVEVEL